MDVVDSRRFRSSARTNSSTAGVGEAWGELRRLGMTPRHPQAVPRSGGLRPPVIHWVSTGYPRGKEGHLGLPFQLFTGHPQVVHELSPGCPQDVPTLIPRLCGRRRRFLIFVEAGRGRLSWSTELSTGCVQSGLRCLLDAHRQLVDLVVHGAAFGDERANLALGVHHGGVVTSAELLPDLGK